MEEQGPRKINFINVVMVAGVTVFGIIIGIIDRTVFGVAPIETLWVGVINSFAATPEAHVTEWNTSTIAMSSTSGFGLMGIMMIVIAGVAIVATLSAACCAGGMD